MSIYAESHRVSGESLPWLHLRTSDGVTYAGWYDARSRDDNDARALCGLKLHYCDLRRCRCPDRHKDRTFSRVIPRERAETDCMACVTASLELENQ